MDWELAKELREAGFPQEPRHDSVADPENPEDVATVPDLPQLVDACCDFLGGFSRGDDCWRAHAHAPFCEGETLAEAVARLWLLRERSARADLRTIAADLERLRCQAQALQTVLLPYLIDMALLEAERLLRDGD
jgi:hypothetical protein